MHSLEYRRVNLLCNNIIKQKIYRLKSIQIQVIFSFSKWFWVV